MCAPEEVAVSTKVGRSLAWRLAVGQTRWYGYGSKLHHHRGPQVFLSLVPFTRVHFGHLVLTQPYLQNPGTHFLTFFGRLEASAGKLRHHRPEARGQQVWT